MEEGGWKNESQWSRFSGFKREGVVGFSRRARFHPNDASLDASMAETTRIVFARSSLWRARRFNQTDDYARIIQGIIQGRLCKRLFLINSILINDKEETSIVCKIKRKHANKIANGENRWSKQLWNFADYFKLLLLTNKNQLIAWGGIWHIVQLKKKGVPFK